MRSVENWAGVRGFTWRRAGPLKDRFELYAGGRTLATLTIGGLAVTTGQVDAGEHRLVLTAEGIGNQRIRISDPDSRRVVASFERHWVGRNGTLRFKEGGQLDWRRAGRWRPAYVFTDRFGSPLLRFKADGSVLADGLGTDGLGTDGLGTGLEAAAGSSRDLVLLLALGWFLLIIAGVSTPARLTAAA